MDNKKEQMQAVQSEWMEQLQQNQQNKLFVRVLWQDGRILYQRFQDNYQRLLALPRKWRRAIRSKLAPSLAAAALMLALGATLMQALPTATITVDGTTCTLADAITAANTDTATGGCNAGSGADTIAIQNNLSLTAVLPNITSNITINGNSNTIQGNDTFRLFTITASGDLIVNDATLSNGYSAGDGGGINNSGTLSLNSVTVSGNNAADNGGGIDNAGTLTISDSTISGNSTPSNGNGGGLYVRNGTVELNNSSISGNTAGLGDGIYVQNGDVTFNGGSINSNGEFAIYVSGGSLTFNASTISGNSGRASYINGGTTTLNNSVISGNGAGLYFGTGNGIGIINNSTITGNNTGLHVYKGNVTINNSTISGNTNRGLFVEYADAGRRVTVNNSTITDNATGLYVKNSNGDITLNHSLISGNSSNEVSISGGTGTVTGSNYNVIGYGGSARSTNFTPSGSDIIPTGALNTILDSTLANNGGATLTHALVSGSAAIDAAPSGACVMSPINQLDQRGYGRLTDGDATDSTLECDVGAVEYGAVPAAFPIYDARLNGVDCLLTDAIEAANTDTAVGDCAAGTGDDTILLLRNSVVSGSTLPTISSVITINGASYLITGSYSYQLFNVQASGDLTLNTVDLMGGNTATDGGIIGNSGTVTVNNSVVTRGYALQDGGGINSSGTLSLNSVTVSGNNAADDGGGIYNTGTLTISNATVSSNNAADNGGGIDNAGTLTISDSTISGNSTPSNGNGGGLYVRNGTVELNNSSISGNTAGLGDGIYVQNGDVTFNGGSINSNGEFAIYVSGGSLTFNASTISGNSGRASYINGGTTTLNNSVISGNGAGLYFGTGNGIGIINNSTITGNNTGLHVYKGNVTINNSTISGNTNRGLFVEYADAGRNVTINNSTITDNATGLYVKNSNGSVILNRSLISGNSSNEVSISGGTGTVTGSNYNVIGYGGSARSTNFTPSGSDIIPTGALNTILDSTLADNGGATLTHALVSGSDAVDIIPTSDADCNSGSSIDQRGRDRANGVNAGGTACDAGAYEYASEPAPTPTSTPTATATAVPPTNTPTATAVPPTNTPTATAVPPTNTPTATAVPPTNTPTATATAVPPTNTPTATATAVPPTNTPTATATAVPPTNTPTATATAVPPTNTPTATAVPPTNTPTATATAVPPTNTPTATATAVPPTNTPTATATAVPPTNTPTATATAVPPTNTPTATATAVPPTNTPTATATAVPPTNTPTATATAVPPTNTPTATATAVPPTNTPTATATNTPIPVDYTIFLPIVMNPSQPDLIITNIQASQDDVIVTIKNSSTRTITEAFWVDAYYNQTPSLNTTGQIWWGLSKANGGIPLAPGKEVILSLSSPYWFGGSLPTTGTTVQGLVDSIGPFSYGNIRESDENNNLSGVIQATETSAQTGSTGEGNTNVDSRGLPSRPLESVTSEESDSNWGWQFVKVLFSAIWQG